MQGWPSALLVATGLSGLFAFGIIQSAFAPQAQALFLVFAAMLAVTTLASRVMGGGHAKAHGGGGHGSSGGHGSGHATEHAVVMSGRSAGTLIIIGGVLGIIFFWNANHWTAEKMGRQIDRGVVWLWHQAQTTFDALTDGEPSQDASRERVEKRA